MQVEVSIEIYNAVTEKAIGTLVFSADSLEEVAATKAMIELQLPKEWAIR